MDHTHWFYKKDDENEIYIDIENFLSAWWVKDILTQSGCCSCTYGNEQPENLIQHYVSPANALLFLKWLLQEIPKLDPGGKKKVVIEIVNKLHLDYVALMTCELQRIMREDSIEPELRNTILTKETFLVKKTWPDRWYIHVKWNLKQIPDKLWNLVNVELVNFKKKWNEKSEALKTIPQQIGRSKELKYLTCYRNDLVSLPSSLQSCQNLERLDISDNRLEELPLFLLDMPKLRLIYRSENPLTWKTTSYDLKCGKLTNEEETPVQEYQQAEKLITITAKFICKQRLNLFPDIEKFNIPQNLKFDLQYQSGSWNYCYACKKGIAKDEEGYKFWFTMDEFIGNTSIPTFCYACSSCKDDVEKSLLKITQNSNTEDALFYKNPDVSIQKLHEKICTCCRARNLLSRIFKRF